MPPKSDELERTCTIVPRVTVDGRRHAFLLVLSGPQFGEMFSLEPDRAVVIGRREDADIEIRDDGVSRRHLSIRVEGDGAVVTDLGSADGICVDGSRVRDARLVDGSRIHLGAQTTLKLVFADEIEARYQMRMVESALQDPLTGLINRRNIEDRLAAELAAGHRHRHPVSLLLVDVDNFKAVNDQYGHLAGDEALKMIAFVLRGALRREDVLGRYGGDEFLVVARETPLAGGRALGDRIRRAVERSSYAWRGRDLTLTVSVGVTMWFGFQELVAGKTERALIERVDHALYLAKHGGRNRVVALPMEKAGPAAKNQG